MNLRMLRWYNQFNWIKLINDDKWMDEKMIYWISVKMTECEKRMFFFYINERMNYDWDYWDNVSGWMDVTQNVIEIWKFENF